MCDIPVPGLPVSAHRTVFKGDFDPFISGSSGQLSEYFGEFWNGLINGAVGQTSRETVYDIRAE
ncbi:hypothetical protein D3C86_2019260 [compost metagenome]